MLAPTMRRANGSRSSMTTMSGCQTSSKGRSRLRPVAPALVSCLSRVVTPTGSYIRPKLIYDNSVPIDEYLFDRRTLFGGWSFIQTSGYLLPRSLFDKVRFDVESPHDDWGFVLRLSKQEGAKIETVPEVLVVLISKSSGLPDKQDVRRGRVLSGGSTGYNRS